MHEARDRNAGIWIEHSDRLYLAAYTPESGLSVRFSGYFRKMNGEIIEYAEIVNPTADRVATEKTVFFGAGFLLSCVANLTGSEANRGQCYVRAQVQRSTGTPAVKLHNVLGGYVTDDYSPSFPYGQIEGSLDGPGYLRLVTGTDPAAGAEISETVPTGSVRRLLSLVATLTCDATAATRQAILVFDDGTNIHTRMPQGMTLTASQSAIFCWHLGSATTSSAAAFSNCPLADRIRLDAFSRFRTMVTNIQAGDNWGAPQFLVEEWIQT